MNQPTNGVTEPGAQAPVNNEEAAGNQIATPQGTTPQGVNPQQPEQEAPAALSQEALSQEFPSNKEATPAPNTEPTQIQTQSPEEHRKIGDKGFNTALNIGSAQLESAIAEGQSLENALDSVTNPSIRGYLKNLQDKEFTEPTGQQPVQQQTPQVDPFTAARRIRAEETAQESIFGAIQGNGLAVQTAQAKQTRDALYADYTRLLKSNEPGEAAKFAIFNAGLNDKAAANAAYKSGQVQANQAVPAPGTPGATPQANIPVDQELSSDQIKGMSDDDFFKGEEAKIQKLKNG